MKDFFDTYFSDESEITEIPEKTVKTELTEKREFSTFLNDFVDDMKNIDFSKSEENELLDIVKVQAV